VADDNFGCGSARACALGADGLRHPLRDLRSSATFLQQFAARTVCSPIKVSPEDLEKLFDDAERAPMRHSPSTWKSRDQRAGRRRGEIRHRCPPQAFCLLNGLDDIRLTLVKGDKITGSREVSKAARAWVARCCVAQPWVRCRR
jgi:3-isopropylmalate/(R)-2-methylmalate dehydratase small subunit